MLDKKTLIGLVLIFAVFIGYGIWTAPSQEERAEAKRKQDSIINVKNQLAKSLEEEDLNKTTDTISLSDSLIESNDLSTFGAFALNAKGEEREIKISNQLLDIKFSTHGALIKEVTLKDYLTYNKKPVTLFKDNGNQYGLNLSVGQNIVRTKDLYFQLVSKHDFTKPINIKEGDSLILIFRASLDSLSTSYMDFKYIIRGNDYRIGYDIAFKNVKGKISDLSFLEFEWQTLLQKQEKDRKVEVNNSSIYYMYEDDKKVEVDYLKENGKDDKKSEDYEIKWVSFKQQFFSTSIIAKNEKFLSSHMQTITDEDKAAKDSLYLRTMKTSVSIPYDAENPEFAFSMDFFFGPNKYNVIKDYDIDMERIIPLGWGFFLMQWVNRFAIIPVFDFLSQFDWNMGIIILVLTILVKIVLFPLAYKSFSSTAKMKVIQPEVQKINEKFPKQEQAMEKQKAVMALYKRAGINPMAGCLPMILQFPILIAMFRFFPASIELRQQSFLWADDLSSYDSILNLPFTIPFYGSHVSLFCLLMTVAQIFYTRMTMKQQQSTNSMPGMKTMMYLMPVMMLFVLNSFSAALNYYYFISMCITFIQVWVIKKTINEQKVLDTLKRNSNKPIKKSKWQERIEALEKQNKTLVEQRQKNKR
ncbi:MAG: membrane protein insertase YidC [Bacteroidales bacterium]|nr:membrane protein insertase YidC [Bacteroidales bacterium]